MMMTTVNEVNHDETKVPDELIKLLILRWWWQPWMKWTTMKQRYRMNLFFAVFRLFVLLPNLVSKLINTQAHY